LYKVVLALLEQLYVQCPTTATEVRDLEIQDTQPRDFPLPKFISVLMSVAARFQKTFIVLDALDECHSDNVPDLDNLARTISTSQCRLFVTARPSHGLSLFTGSNCPTIQIQPSEDDMEKFVRAKFIQIFEKRAIFDKTQEDMIKTALVQLGAQHGM
jgi:hypothetical protein